LGLNYSALSGLARLFYCGYQGRRASRLPLAIILRAFGAEAALSKYDGTGTILHTQNCIDKMEGLSYYLACRYIAQRYSRK